MLSYNANYQITPSFASKHLSNRLLELGFTNVMKYPEGIDDWQAQGHKIEQAE